MYRSVGLMFAIKIRMRDLHAAIDHRDRHAAAGDTHVPRRNHINVFTGHAEQMLQVGIADLLSRVLTDSIDPRNNGSFGSEKNR